MVFAGEDGLVFYEGFDVPGWLEVCVQVFRSARYWISGTGDSTFPACGDVDSSWFESHSSVRYHLYLRSRS